MSLKYFFILFMSKILNQAHSQQTDLKQIIMVKTCDFIKIFFDTLSLINLHLQRFSIMDRELP